MNRCSPSVCLQQSVTNSAAGEEYFCVKYH